MSTDQDPHEVLGLSRDATWDEVRAARRRLAKDLHPDLHLADAGAEARADAQRRLAAVNRAVDELRAARGESSMPDPRPPPAPSPVVEGLSFVIEASPAVAFEAVLMSAVELGDVIHVDEPTLLGVLLDDPGPCQCLVELSPRADGGSVLTLDVGPRSYGRCPSVTDVRDALVAQVQRFFDAES